MSILLSLLSVWLTITPIEYVATGYAPLDPRAVRGVCYSGNPKITASGRLTKPGVSVAAPRHIPFGTWLYIHGLGLRGWSAPALERRTSGDKACRDIARAAIQEARGEE